MKAQKPKPISVDDIGIDLANIGTPNEDGIVRFTLRPKNNADIKYNITTFFYYVFYFNDVL